MKSIVIKFVNFSFVVLAILIYSCGSDPVTTPPVSKNYITHPYTTAASKAPAMGANTGIQL